MLFYVELWYVVGLFLSVVLTAVDIHDRRRHYDVKVTVADVIGVVLLGLLGPFLITILLESNVLDKIIQTLNKFELFKLDKFKKD